MSDVVGPGTKKKGGTNTKRHKKHQQNEIPSQIGREFIPSLQRGPLHDVDLSTHTHAHTGGKDTRKRKRGTSKRAKRQKKGDQEPIKNGFPFFRAKERDKKDV